MSSSTHLALALAVAFALLAGCTASPIQFAGIAVAHELRDRSIVEIQFHEGHFGEGASVDTARAGIDALDHVEAIRVGELAIANATIDRDNQTILFDLPTTGFDAFHMNATFVLRNGTRLNTSAIEWHEEYRRPWQAEMALSEANGATTIDMALKEVVGIDLVTARGVKAIATWTTHIVGTNGTAFDDTTIPALRNGAISLTLPYGSVQEAAPSYHLQLSDGTTISDRDVDGDHYPTYRNTELAQKQQN